jgi:uncharacterized protein involved in exopolysaccharide biosynthesis/Mrp family chromosome partitioning ATPase
MNPKNAPPPPPAPTITLGDIYYILFRHKWLILILSLVAISTAAAVFFLWHLPYQSEAKVLIKYVKEVKPPVQDPTAAQVTVPDHGENIINSEVEILTSMDLANDVVDNLGPTKILAKAGGGTNKTSAAFVIRSGLLLGVTNHSDVIDLIFTHPDAEMVQPILGALIVSYLHRHDEIHRPEFNEFLTEKVDEVKHKLDDTDSQLRDAKNAAGIISPLEESKKTLADMSAKIQQELYEAQAQMADEQETILALQRLAGKAPPPTNASASSTAPAPVPPDKIGEYQKLCNEYFSLQAKETDLLGIYTTNNPIVQTAHQQVVKAEAAKKSMEEAYPGLIVMQPTTSSRGTTSAAAPMLDPATALQEEEIKKDALAARVKALNNNMAEIKNDVGVLTSKEGLILQLQRDRDQEATELSFYAGKLDESKAEEALSNNSSIAVVEAPTPPSRDPKKLYKITAGIAVGGLAFAFLLPFLIELYLDRTLKHPTEVQSSLGLPFFISIPEMNGNGSSKKKALKDKVSKRKALADKSGKGADVPPIETVTPPANGHLALWDRSHSLQPFYETLRDRLMTYFEMINLTHKPKLVAVTSCGAGAGVTSTAAGLASSLSETGDGNVLLVDMNVRDGEAHHFYKGKLTCGLDQVLEKETREEALVQGNLYVAREQDGDDKLPRILPKRFSHLLPKMKASDFDYIIFDMPPVSQISITPRLARFMDMVLLVVESEKTDRDAAKRVATMLSESKTNVGVVLNKNRTYLPRRLHQEV